MNDRQILAQLSYLRSCICKLQTEVAGGGGGGGSTPDLQAVTTVGNTSDNGVALIDGGYLSVGNIGTGRYTILNETTLTLSNTAGTANGDLQGDNITVNRLAQLPDGNGTLTLSVNGVAATIAGNIPISFQSVLDNNNIVIDSKGFSLRDSTNSQHVTVSDLVNSGWIKDIIIDQPSTSIGFRNGNSDNGTSTIARIGNNIAEFRITSKNATNGSSVPINGFITHYCYNTSNAAVLKQQIGSSGNASIGVMNSISSGSADPTTSDIPSGFSAVWKNTTSGDIKLWVNDGGTMKASVALT